ncbi:F-box/LRR-repeat protein 16-like [Limulus polyphemus]|uniref:F-box/LRR-repeat protein 16-like n=1 Tax=Limulus polyphemus TaxID=6850 RepID=A0ABM1SH45_LIMPO|nr:F-box/LRR-repeat protein 16-like [Limulus polyphemus]XP_022242950.1 F-box/LRR-repeat protein 16-like [Limulus polyphemus]
MSTDVSFTKRAAAELSRCFNGLAVRGRANNGRSAGGLTSSPSSVGQGSNSRHDVSPSDKKKIPRVDKIGQMREYLATVKKPRTLSDLWQDSGFLGTFFWYFIARDRNTLAQVCQIWRDVLYQPKYWKGVLPILRCRELRSPSGDLAATSELRKRVYLSLERRGFDSACLFGANDEDVYDFVSNCPPSQVRNLRHVALRCCNVTDKGLEALLETLQAVTQLELFGCNEITDAGLWASFSPRIVSLTLADCINIADESVAAVTQLLPSLYELNLQAYHVTDAALAFFGPRQSATLIILRLRSCWEITNHGLLNLVHALPNLSVLSLSGCSKITDDGVELVAENLRQLRSLDLSWCPRITDAALEYIACDLTQLEELTLDRCMHITDIGLGYLSTMANLCALYLRWCSQIRDFGIQHLCSMRHLQILSLAGCPLVTSVGLSSIVQLRHLQELELTNCPGTSVELFEYLRENLPSCMIIE